MNHKIFLALTFGLAATSFALNAQEPNEKFLTSWLSSYRYANLIMPANDSLVEYEFFRTQSYNKLNDNERTLDAFVLMPEQKIKKTRNRYFHIVAELEKKNEALKIRIAGYQPGSQKNWFAFRQDFTLEMEDLSADLSNLRIEKP